MRKFTQGKWIVDKHLDVKCGSRYIAPISIFTKNETRCFATSQDKANARLIVNAPKMYDLLEKIVRTRKTHMKEIQELLKEIDDGTPK